MLSLGRVVNDDVSRMTSRRCLCLRVKRKNICGIDMYVRLYSFYTFFPEPLKYSREFDSLLSFTESTERNGQETKIKK